jgi:serine/threonine protein kinase
MIRIDRRQLGTLTPLGQGGMAQVYLVRGNVPQLPGQLAFKELKPVVVDPIRTQLLHTMRQAVELRDAMSPAEQSELDGVAVWPLAMVHDQGTDVGILMQCIPDGFFIDAKPTRRVFEFQLLGAGPDQAKALGIDRSRAPADKDLVRLALMARLAYAVEVIHRPRGSQRLVYGDLSLRNAAVATSRPRILLMDCDGVAAINDTSRVQPNTPFFVPPELVTKQQKLQDQLTDVYKLGLCVIRGLATGRGATQLNDPASPLVRPGLLDQTGIDLLHRAVSRDRDQRPTAEEIKDYLIGRVLDLADPPSLLSARLSSDVALRGSEVFVRWTHKGAKTVRIYSDVKNFTVKDLDADAYPNGYPIKPPTACEIWVAVANDHGEDEGPAGQLHYYEVPPVQISVNPPPVVLPDLPAMRLPETRAELPPYPMHPADAVPLPPLRWPPVPPLKLAEVAPPRLLEVAPLQLRALVPQAPLRNGLRGAVSHAYRAADAGIDVAIRGVLRRRAQELRTEAERDVSTS